MKRNLKRFLNDRYNYLNRLVNVMKKEQIKFLLITVGLAILITACVPGSGKFTAETPAGFFTGIWHGWIAPISLILGLFNPDIRVYESFNTGWWYDFGFYIAIISGFGGIAFTRKKNKTNGSAQG